MKMKKGNILKVVVEKKSNFIIIFKFNNINIEVIFKTYNIFSNISIAKKHFYVYYIVENKNKLKLIIYY